jgi:hypothetical protein
MKITELLEERQQVDELNMAQVGNAIGKGATAVGKGIGATASGAVQTGKNFWSGLKQGWKAGQGAVAGNEAPAAGPAAGQGVTAAPAAATAAEPSGQPTTNAQAAPTQAGPTAGQGATAAPAAAGQGGNGGGAASRAPAAGDISSIMKTIDSLDKPTKQQLAGELEKNITSTPEPKAPAATPAAPGQPAATPAAPGQPAATPAAPGQQKLSAKDQNALKARLKAKQGTAAKTQSGFNQYVQGGGGSTLAGADAQGNPVFKQNVQREGVEFYSKFLGQML